VVGTATGPTTRERVVGGALACLAEHGLVGTTVDDVAVAAGVSRATLYRAFPGGRDTVLATVVDTELARLFEAIREAADAASDLGGALTAGLQTAAVWLRDHEVLERLMFDEPATLLTHLEFAQMDRTLATASAGAAPLLERFLPAPLAERVGEWAARICLSYVLFPAEDLDLCEGADAARVVARYLLPGVEALRAGGA
jgi:AcrR family transcriptional regulator